MAAPYLKSLDISNYRGLASFKITDFRRINLIGGLNGAGKTTLLEAIFTFMDQFGPLSFARPVLFRQLPKSMAMQGGTLFGDRKHPVILTANAGNRTTSYSLTWERQVLEGQVPFAAVSQDGETVGQVMGLTVKVVEGPAIKLHRTAVPTGDGFALHDKANTLNEVPQAAFLSRSTVGNVQDMATRFSTLLSQGRKKDIISLANILQDNVEDLVLLQIENVPILHVQLTGGSLVPLSYAGEGVQTIISIGMSIMLLSGGVLLLDEFEAAIHYTRLEQVWHHLGELASAHNCQIFVATHSRENIDAAVQSTIARKRKDDICYYRLDRFNGIVKATRFDSQQLQTADLEEWEVR